MNRLSKEKRSQLILVILVTILVMAGLWFGLITIQQGSLASLATDKITGQGHLDKTELAIKNADIMAKDLMAATNKLAQLEDDMAPGDPLSWMVTKMEIFRLSYKVDMPQISPPNQNEVDVIAKFP